MKRFVWDGAAVQDRASLHRQLAEGLDFPAWYGRNLDALYDCLCDLGETSFTVTHAAALEKTLGDYWERVRRVLLDSAAENGKLHLDIREESMMNTLREHFAKNESVLGTFFNAGDSSCMECLGYTGLDFVIIDTEHGPYDTETMMDRIRAAESVGLAPLVRIADVTHKEIQRAADCGACGLIVPCLNTMEEFEKLADLAKFPPLGNRGFIKGRGCGFGNQPWASGTLEDYMAYSNEKLLVMPQCETAKSLEIVEQVAALPGVDGIFIGPFDLSISLGVPGQFDSPVFCAAVERIKKACHDVGKPCYIFSLTVEDARRRLAQGYDGVALNLTSSILTEAYREKVKAIQA